MRNLNIEENVLIFKSVAILYLFLITSVSQAIINQLSTIEKTRTERKKPKIKTFNTFKQLRRQWPDVIIFTKVVSLKYSWIKRSFDEDLHAWKKLPAYVTETNLCKNTPSFCEEIMKNYPKYLLCFLHLPSAILCQFLWFNSNF